MAHLQARDRYRRGFAEQWRWPQGAVRLSRIEKISCFLSSRRRGELHDLMYQVEAAKRDNEHHPAGKFMKETQRLIRVPVLYAKPRADDAEDVRCDGDRDAGNGQNHPPTRRPLEEVAVEDGQREE